MFSTLAEAAKRPAAKRPAAKRLAAKCPSAKCLAAKCPAAKCRGCEMSGCEMSGSHFVGLRSFRPIFHHSSSVIEMSLPPAKSQFNQNSISVPENNLSCPICGFIFKSQLSLKAHNKKKQGKCKPPTKKRCNFMIID
ncbi:hypothetical protein B9Z55_028343 [Caenorhabditis nigoni]|uniref:C2H2-type domain-containing protein n=1 Tax=Caenorhabditis nigoni TaxID=1611254 RepID=A0A2G5SBZ0_9PELO|nr:hypothetical protein B9Z55_028343 [Caenorhabditis nigoni]